MSSLLPTDGSILVHEAADYHLSHHPNDAMYIFSPDDKPGSQSVITRLEFARAIDRMAGFLSPSGAGPEREVVAIIAQADVVVYHAVVLGLMKAGCIPFLISPTNSPAGLLNLLERSNSHKLLVTGDCRDTLGHGLLREIAEKSPDLAMKLVDFPSLSDAFPFLARETQRDAFEPYSASTSSSRPSKFDVALYLHSSGSTGLPKAIPIPHATLLNWAAFSQIHEVRTSMVAAFTMPPFGVAGVGRQILLPLFAGIPVFVFPPTQSASSLSKALTAENVMEHMRRNRLPKLTVFPAFLHTWAADKDAVAFLRSLDYIAYGGGPLLPSVGKALVEQGVNLRMSYGSTEIGLITMYEGERGREDWEYLQLNPLVQMRLSARDDGAFEADVLSTDQHHLPIIDTPDKMGYNLPDLFEKHPAKEGLWRILGRKDDVFVDATGANVVPGPIEAILCSNPCVKNAIMFGQHRTQTGILIQLTEDAASTDDEAALRDKVWPSIQEGNEIIQRYAGISKSMILFTALDKPLPLNAKGLVRRKDALKLYEREIEAIYLKAEVNEAICEIASL
ncbi:hypothetical protein HGRIS_006394 [Hohenbuehelia grisea]|uniref:AMP-dependent synthetase/ligase domain-containing protein n=1 Tax=Hohenbuehelia grisea TaxID=104357 RepID=A0ABR3K0U3_9AGAR